jgi:hypothetical protein
VTIKSIIILYIYIKNERRNKIMAFDFCNNFATQQHSPLQNIFLNGKIRKNGCTTVVLTTVISTRTALKIVVKIDSFEQK